MESPRTLASMHGADLRYDGAGNELALDGKAAFNDPVKYRGGGRFPGGYYVILSGDFLQGSEDNPQPRLEQGFIGIRHNDDFPKDVLEPEFVVFLKDELYLRLTRTYLEVCGHRVPLTGGGAAGGDALQSQNGRYKLQMQGDGNLVLVDYGVDPPRPLWATGTNQ